MNKPLNLGSDESIQPSGITEIVQDKPIIAHESIPMKPKTCD